MTIPFSNFNTRTSLYYPDIRIPTNYLKQMLLYWDQIASIIPESAEDVDPSVLTPEMEYLKSLSIFKAIRPEKFISNPLYKSEIDNLRTEFTSIIDDIHIYPSNKSEASYHIHYRKMYAELGADLQKRTLLLSSKISGFNSIEKHAGYVYMSLLAKYLSNIQNDLVVPITDNNLSQEISFALTRRAPNRTACFSNLLRNILPLPTNDVSIDDILKFKEQRRDELSRFRLILDDFNKKIISATSQEELLQITATFKDELSVGVSDLCHTMKESWTSYILGSIESLIAMAPSLFSAYCDMLNTEEKLQPIREMIKTGAEVSGIIYLSTKLAQVLNNKDNTIRQSPYSYLLHTHERFRNY